MPLDVERRPSLHIRKPNRLAHAVTIHRAMKSYFITCTQTLDATPFEMAGAIVEVIEGHLSGNRIIKWDGKTVTTFAIDLRERGVPMQQTH